MGVGVVLGRGDRVRKTATRSREWRKTRAKLNQRTKVLGAFSGRLPFVAFPSPPGVRPKMGPEPSPVIGTVFVPTHPLENCQI